MSGSFGASLGPLLLALALALCLGNAPASAADSAVAPKEHSVTIQAMPPSISVDASTDAEDRDRSGSTSEGRKRSTRHARVEIGPDGDYSSFSALIESDPWLGALIFMAVALVFLVPIVLLIGIIWYKLRKTRLQNEAMIAMAERGVPPSAGAAVAGTGAPPFAGVPSYEQAVAASKRAVMSDLRKGTLMIAFGLALAFYSLIDDQSANWLGLTLLFVGIAYVVLWWVEEQKIARAGQAPGPTR